MCLAQQEKRKKVYLGPKQSFKYLAIHDETSKILISELPKSQLVASVYRIALLEMSRASVPYKMASQKIVTTQLLTIVDPHRNIIDK